MHGSLGHAYFENEFAGHIMRQRFGSGHRTLVDGDALLVKGSNSVGLSALVRALAATPAASAVSREGV